jgi:hypothetical protein
MKAIRFDLTSIPCEGRGWGLGLYFTQLRTAINYTRFIYVYLWFVYLEN